MRKKLVTFLLILTLLPFDIYAQDPVPGYALPVTYTADYIVTLLALMGVSFDTYQNRDEFVGDFITQNVNSVRDIYDQMFDQLQYEQLLPGQEYPGGPQYQPPEDKMIAFPIVPGLVESIKSFFLEKTQSNNSITPEEYTTIDNYVKSIRVGEKYQYFVLSVSGEYDPGKNPFQRGDKIIMIAEAYHLYGPFTSFVKTSGKYTYLEILQKDRTPTYMTIKVLRNGKFSSSSSQAPWHDIFTMSYKSNLITSNYKSFVYTASSSGSSYVPPVHQEIKTDIVSPYTGISTITLPHPSAPRLPVPLSPDEYVEPVPDIYPGYIPTPELPPNIDPETGLPYNDENGLPILIPDIIVPGVEDLPVPEPEVLTNPKDYSPTLTKILNGIRQIPEKIVNPVKNIIVPPEIPQIDFSPLSVPLTRKFPFSIPFDLHNAFKGLDAEAAAPRWEIPLKIGYGAFLGTSQYDTDDNIVIDMAEFTTLANIARYFNLLIFMVGLIIVTRIVIRG